MAQRLARVGERARELGPFAPLHVAFALSFALLLWQVRARLSFPWDLMVWAEGPFMTNMLKLDAGSALYTSPADANSFVYAPALEQLTFHLLRPFGVHLDVRACRAFSAVVGLLAATTAASAAARLTLGRDKPGQTALFLVFALLVFKSFTADTAHPDNLHLLHFGLCLQLGLQALETGRMRWALAALVLGGAGVLVKQSAAGAAMGLALAFALSRKWRGREIALFFAVAAASTGASLALLWLPPHARFWTIEVLSQHPFEPRFSSSFEDVYFLPFRLIVWGLGLWGMAAFWRAGSRERASFWLLAALGASQALPALLAYAKVMGAWNNLTVIDLWMLLFAAPELVRALGAPTRFAERVPGEGRAHLFVGAVLWASLLPTRAVSDDLAEGRRVLVAHGASFHIRAGYRGVLLDRGNSVLELAYGGAADRAATRTRMEAALYDRIYLNSLWYDASIASAWRRRYRIIERLPAVNAPRIEYRWGWQYLMPQVEVLAPLDAPSSSPHEPLITPLLTPR
jgi:hypothetical protein